MHLSLYPAAHTDLENVLLWLPDASACRLWAGPAVRFPAIADSLWVDLGGDAQNLFVLRDALGETPIAFGQVVARENKVVHLARLIVSPPHRGHGIGRQLCLALMHRGADVLGAREFTLRVYQDNRAAIMLYRSLGFVEEESSQDPSIGLLMRKHDT